MTHTVTSVSCPTCQTTFHGVSVDSDESGSYAALEARPCAECGKPLCGACAQFACDGCGHTFCREHAVSIPDGPDRPLLCCAACAEECEVEYCPYCDSPEVRVSYEVFGVDPETGYHDEAAIFTCAHCGARGDSEELVRRPAVEPELPARIEPAREVARVAKIGEVA